MREVKYSFMYTDGVEWLDYRFDMREILNGDPFDVISDSPLLRKFRMVCSRQFAGRKDKNGVEIYEGGILDLEGFGVARVEYIEEFMTFCPFSSEQFEWYKSGSNHFKYCMDGDEYRNGQRHFLFQYEPYEMEVIGSIYENPELLEGKTCKSI